MGAKRGLRGFEPEDDRSILTIDMTREELGILIDAQRKQQSIKKIRLILNDLHRKRQKRNCRPMATVKRLPILWHKVKKTIRKQIDEWQQELPLF